MKSIRPLLLSVAACATSVFIAGAADARTIPAAAGMPASLTAPTGGQSLDDFAWLNTGLLAPNATSTSSRTWVIALPMDAPGLKFFVVKGTPSPSLSCLLEQRGTVQQSVAIPVSSVGTSPPAVLLDVVAGNTVVLRCTFTSSNGRLLLVDYTP